MEEMLPEERKIIPSKEVTTLDHVVIRLAGDSGDGMQLAGLKFTTASVIFGNDISTFPDFPGEIRLLIGQIPVNPLKNLVQANVNPRFLTGMFFDVNHCSWIHKVTHWHKPGY